MGDKCSLNQRETWPLSSASRPFCSAKPTVAGRHLQENAGSTQKYENQTSRGIKTELQEVPKSNFQKYENRTSGSMKTEFQEVPKSYSNKTEYSETDYSDTEFNETNLSETEKILSNPILSAEVDGHPDWMDTIGKMDAYRELIRERIEYPCHKSKEVDELVELVVEVLMMPDDSTLRIAGVEKPVLLVKSRFMKLDYSHIEYVLFSLQRNTAKVGNIKAYLLTTLYNATMTMNHYYQAEVNHDLYGGG